MENASGDQEKCGVFCTLDASDPVVGVDGQLKQLFLSVTSFKDHYEAQSKFETRYFAMLYTLLKENIQINENAKTLALAAAWARKDYKKAGFLLQIPGEVFSIKEVLKAISLLDTARQKRCLKKLLKRLEAQGCKKKSKMNRIKSLIGSLEAETPFVGSLSRALTRQIKLWVKRIPAERLKFFALYFPTESWKKLSDLCHLHPEKDFPQSPWFLPYCFGKELPEFIKEANNMSNENISELVMKSEIDYSVVRKHKDGLIKEAKEKIATYTKLDTVLWYYEELDCEEVDTVVEQRLKGGEEITLPYGKLMERIIYFKYSWKQGKVNFIDHLVNIANKQLSAIRFHLESPVSVIGDMSGSMDVAIRTSNIIASLLTAITNADLVFFDNRNEIPPFIPKDVSGVIELCDLIKSRGSTIPAVSLYPYYAEKKVFKTFFIITDEEENGIYNGHDFANLFKKYYHEIHPSRLVFISFLLQHRRGYMVEQLKKTAPEIDVIQFCFEKNRPDLSKLDHIFGLLSSDGEAFTKKVDEYQKLFARDDFNDLDALQVNSP